MTEKREEDERCTGLEAKTVAQTAGGSTSRRQKEKQGEKLSPVRLSRDSSNCKAEGSPEVAEASEVSRKVEKRNGADLRVFLGSVVAWRRKGIDAVKWVLT